MRSEALEYTVMRRRSRETSTSFRRLEQPEQVSFVTESLDKAVVRAVMLLPSLLRYLSVWSGESGNALRALINAFQKIHSFSNIGVSTLWYLEVEKVLGFGAFTPFSMVAEEHLIKLDSLLFFLHRECTTSPYFTRLFAVLVECHHSHVPEVNMGFRYSKFWSAASRNLNTKFSVVELYLADLLFRMLCPGKLQLAYSSLTIAVPDTVQTEDEGDVKVDKVPLQPSVLCDPVSLGLCSMRVCYCTLIRVSFTYLVSVPVVHHVLYPHLEMGSLTEDTTKALRDEGRTQFKNLVFCVSILARVPLSLLHPFFCSMSLPFVLSRP